MKPFLTVNMKQIQSSRSGRCSLCLREACKMVKRSYLIAQILLSHYRRLLITFVARLFVPLYMSIVKNLYTIVNSNAPCCSDNAPLPLEKEHNTD